MRYRDYKVFRSGHYYHVYNRGVNKQEIFLDEQDYQNFIKRLMLVLSIKTRVPLGTSRINGLKAGSFSIIAYCLMPNHFHLLIRQNTDLGIDKLMLKVTTSYAIYFNKKYKRVGPLCQDCFKSKLVDHDAYLTYLTAYIHNNPTQPLTWEFSSFKDYLGLRQGGLCQKNLVMLMFQNDPQKYKNFVLDFNQEDQLQISEVIFEEG